MKYETPEMFEIGSATKLTLRGEAWPSTWDLWTGYRGFIQIP
jgi:hypothetical protein